MTSLKLAINFQSVDPSRGGAETYVADLCRRLIAAGHQVDLIAESWADGVLPPEVRTHRVRATGVGRLGRVGAFAINSEVFLRKRHYECTIGFINTYYHDVIIPQGGVRQASLEFNARRFPEGWRRSLYLAAKRFNPKHTLYSAIEAKQYDPDQGAQRVVAVSKLVQGHLERFHRVPADRIRVIPNAIDAGRLGVADPAGVRASTRAAHGLKPDDVAALFVGHNYRLKGLPDLLESLHLYTRRVANPRPIHLLVCGGGALGPMRRIVQRLGLNETVRLIGFADDIRALYHASDFLVLPTYYDPCSLVVFEALACGLPVITTACNGAGELLTSGREGVIVPHPSDHPALADAIAFLADDHKRAECSRHARTLGHEQSMERHVERLVAVFEEVAASKRMGLPPRAQRRAQHERLVDASHRSGGR